MIIDTCFRRGILASHAHHPRARGEVARHRGLVVIHPHVDGRDRPTEPRGNRIVRSDIDDRRQYAAMRVAALGVDYPFLAPRRLHLYAVLIDLHHGEVEPLVEGAARNEALQLFHRESFFRHIVSRLSYLRLGLDLRPQDASSPPHYVQALLVERALPAPDSSAPSATHFLSSGRSTLFVPASGSCFRKYTRRGCW